MLYQQTSVTVHTFKGAPMAEKMIKDLTVPSKSAGDVKGGRKANKKASRKSR
jgi:Rod binding domain-containing protein